MQFPTDLFFFLTKLRTGHARCSINVSQMNTLTSLLSYQSYFLNFYYLPGTIFCEGI